MESFSVRQFWFTGLMGHHLYSHYTFRMINDPSKFLGKVCEKAKRTLYVYLAVLAKNIAAFFVAILFLLTHKHERQQYFMVRISFCFRCLFQSNESNSREI